MTRDEKLRIARALERMRVDVIEAGFPAASNGDFEAVRAIAGVIKDSTVCGLCRANDRDIQRAIDALKGAKGLARPCLYRHQRVAHGEEAAHESRAGAGAVEAVRTLRAQALPGRGVLAGGRLALRARIFSAGCWRR